MGVRCLHPFGLPARSPSALQRFHHSTPASLHRVPGGAGSPASTVLSGAATPGRPSRRTSFPSFGGTSHCTWLETTGPPTFLGDLDCAFALLSDPGRSVRIRPGRRLRRFRASLSVALSFGRGCLTSSSMPPTTSLQCDGTSPAQTTTKAPALRLSRLNHTASALAVYASQWWIAPPPRKTRFWLPGQALPDGLGYPKGPGERFQSHRLRLHDLIPLSQASWRKVRLVILLGGDDGVAPFEGGVPAWRPCR